MLAQGHKDQHAMLSAFRFRISSALLLLSICFCSTSQAYERPLHKTGAVPPQKTQQLIIKFNPQISADKTDRLTLHRKLGITPAQVREFRHLPHQVIRLPDHLSLEEALAFYRQQPDVVYAETDYPIRLNSVSPDDVQFEQQWYLGEAGINATRAWDQNVGDARVVIAVLDSGIDYHHPDLQDNIWRNPDETADGKDNDNNGYVDDIHGINTVTGTGDPMDTLGHGTHVAGIIAASGNNGVGIAGVSWRSKLLSCRFIDENAQGDTSDAIACLDYLYHLKVERGVNLKASTNSWGSTHYSQALYDAIAMQAEAGILFITGAGNLDSHQAFYPGAYDLPNIITLAAHNAAGYSAASTNLGRSWVDLAAPGQSILSTWPQNEYRSNSGTSMAAPVATGVVALVASAYPQMNWRQLRFRMLASGQVAEDTRLQSHTGTGKKLKAWGENSNGVINCRTQQTRRRLLPEDQSFFYAGDQVQVQILAVDCLGPTTPGKVRRLDTGEDIPLNDLGLGADAHAGDGIYSGSLEFPGDYLELVFEGLPGGQEVIRILEPQLDYCNQHQISQIPLEECNALVSFYYATQGQQWLKRDNWLETTEPCGWHGVVCTEQNEQIPEAQRQVQQLVMVNNRLLGQLPESLGQLQHLQRLDLSKNQLTGPWPENLSQLQQLEILWLWANPLETQLPELLGELSQLRSIDLTQSSIYGPLPESIGQLTQLENIYLADNYLSGEIDALALLPRLRHLDLGNNQFSGSPLALLQAQTQLERLHLGGNQFEGRPLDAISQMPNLQSLTLYDNDFSGEIPEAFGQLQQLQLAYLSDNHFSGSVPESLGQLQALDTLLLTGNRELRGPLPLSLSQLTQLEFFDIGQTALCAPDNSQFNTWLLGLNHHNAWRYCRDNRAPVISLVSNQTATGGNRVELAAQASDPDGDLLTYEWTQVSGPSVQIDNKQAANTSFTSPAVNSETALVFQVEVSDGIDTRKGTLSVSVKPREEKKRGGGGSLHPAILILLSLLGGFQVARRTRRS
jgi:Leucine-rich repeat (LRR) protein